jgi:hypothetical protein
MRAIIKVTNQRARPYARTMIRTAALFLSLPLLIQCAAPALAPEAGQAGLHGDALECIDLTRVSARRAESADRIRFEMLGGAAYVNQLPGRCPGLARSADFGALAFEVQGNRLCRGDKVSAVDPALGGYRQSIPCLLGRFTPVAPEGK